MPLPLLFIGVAAISGAVGAKKSVSAGIDTYHAKEINKNANELIEESATWLNEQRLACGRSLQDLGKEKVWVLNNSVMKFLNTFAKIKNVDFRDSVGLDELSKLKIEEKDFEELRSMVNFAGSIAGGTVAGTAGGALIALGAYGAAQALAVASTGTAIASLSGVAASNATLAFFGGGSLAAGGLGVKGGALVLGGLVVGPALLVVGMVTSSAAKKNLNQAYTNREEAIQIAEQHSAGALQCEAIRRRTYMFYNLLARLDTYFLPLIYKMEDIFNVEGDDYRAYQQESKKAIASCASVAVSIKALLDTQLLTDDGLLTDESERMVISTEESLGKLSSALLK